MGCAVQAALPGFDSSSISIANRNVQDNPNIGTITLKREDGSAGAAVSSTTATAPKDADESLRKGAQRVAGRKTGQGAERSGKSRASLSAIRRSLVSTRKDSGSFEEEEAGNSFSKAVAADPKFILPYEQLAAISAQAGKWQELVDYTSHELELNPRGNPQTWYYHALGNLKLGKMDVAQVSARKRLRWTRCTRHLIPSNCWRLSSRTKGTTPVRCNICVTA